MSANTPVGVDDSRADEEPVVSLKDVSVHYNTQGYLERLFSDEDRTVRAVDGGGAARGRARRGARRRGGG
jgi:hypothetical protein